jgi:curved DNA-binding protein CbpA
MSAPLAGKFQDHYSILGVEPRATAEAIQTAYTRLAQKYHPSTPQTGDQDKFDSINLAYEVLSDAGLRLEFDNVKGLDQDDSNLMFAGFEFFDALGRQAGLRAAILCVLYDRRRKKPSKPSLSMRHIEGIIFATNDELVFSLFYLKQRGLAVGDDKSNLQITVDGMDFLESDHPAPEKVFPFIKPAALSVPAERSLPALASAVVQPEGALAENESVMNVLTRALARR